MNDNSRPRKDRAQRPSSYSAQSVRQGVILLCHPWQIWVFVGGLAGCVILLLAAILFTHINP